jgi:hypothetical protein
MQLRVPDFALQTDEEAGVAIRTCTDCGQKHLMGDSADYVDEAAPRRTSACARTRCSS